MTSATVIALAGGNSRAFRGEDIGYYFLTVAIIGLPFVVLALARTRDWFAWLLAIGLTVAVWGYYLSRPYEGVNFLWGFILTFIAPFLIGGISLSVAGMRGRIPDWGQEESNVKFGSSPTNR